MKYLGDMTLSEAANWMDDIKKDDSKDFMKSWHDINLDKGATTMPEAENVVSTLLKTMKELDKKEVLSDEEIKLRILYLHFILRFPYTSDTLLIHLAIHYLYTIYIL